MTDDIDWQILDRHLAGTASPDDDVALRRWLASDARHAIVLDRLRQGEASTASWNADVAWSLVAARLEHSQLHARVALPRVAGSAPRRTRPLAWLAAGMAAAAVLATLLPHPRRAAPGTAVVPRATHIVSAANGQQSTVTLGDGTRVRLNAGSTLRYTDDYGRLSRDVQLEGEAYFEVLHDGAHPFRVHSRGGVVEDLGTRFLVRGYPELARLEVAVAEGTVALRREASASDSTLLGPGQLGRLGSDGAVTVESGVDLERWTAWTHGVLALDGMTLADAGRTIGRRFDVDVVIRGSQLGSRRLSGRFHDESLSAVLDAVAVALDARWTRDGRTITIAPAG